MRSKARLCETISTVLHGRQLVVVSNREPYVHEYAQGAITCLRPASGVAVSLDAVMRESGGIWIAHGAGSADRASSDARGRLEVPPDDYRYTLRRVWLTPEEEAGYYYGCANEALWPLCHIAYSRPTFRQSDWEHYRAVNVRFAEAVLDEVGAGPAVVFIQDYHFALLAAELKARRPDLSTALFWHIPWPNREAFRILPWKAELLNGLLANDLVCFHLHYHCQNFLDTVDREIEARVLPDRAFIDRGTHRTAVRPFPIGVDFDQIADVSSAARVEQDIAFIRDRYAIEGQIVGLGVDRLDYTKGIPERLEALDRLLARRPDLRGRLTFVQVGVPTRSRIVQYRNLSDEVEQLIGDINLRWGTPSWQPVAYLHGHFDLPMLVALYRIAAFCVVSSLHDGMNLVAKEFVASREDGDGVLVLSEFTGAARELHDAVLINPYDVDGFAGHLERAVDMPEPERRARMRRMREIVSERDVYDWARKILTELARVDRLAPPV